MGLLVLAFFGMFFLGALICGHLENSPLEVGLDFLPSSLLMGTLSLGFAERLIMGSARARTDRRLGWRWASFCSPGRRWTALAFTFFRSCSAAPARGWPSPRV